MAFSQILLQANDKWTVQLDSEWDVLGPFPIHAREQYYLSPAFPLDLSQAIDYDRLWPSSYADEGHVGWTKSSMDPDGSFEITFPAIRWKDLRATEGWTALQHHAIVRTTLTLYPSTTPSSDSPPRLLIDLKQGSYFSLLPQLRQESFVPEWHAGNIYAIGRSLPSVVEIPTPLSFQDPTKFDLFVSGDYEIRLFGDPHNENSETPVQRLNVDVSLLNSGPSLLRQSSQDVSCDFLSGYAFGDSIGIGIQSLSDRWIVKAVKIHNSAGGLGLRLLRPVAMAATQTRIVPIVLEQSEAFFEDAILFELLVETASGALDSLSVSLPVKHHKGLSPRQTIIGTYLYANSVPTPFIAVPPSYASPSKPGPPVLALHGAGVDILVDDFWAEALPERTDSWTVIPTGRTSWGLDWHGPSVKDAWASLEALERVVEKAVGHGLSHLFRIPSTSKAIIIGHSNGGQGTWHIASRFPDQVLAALPASAYIKSQAYVPLTLARHAHFIDPTLRSILESALTPDDNDLHLSNLVDIPILAIHGGADENVPVWHSREIVGVLKTLYPWKKDITFKEVPGEGHWYDDVLNNPTAHSFLDGVVSESNSHSAKRSETISFTLTVTAPQESGSLGGWKVSSLKIPGRLGRLHVRQVSEGAFTVETSNIRSFIIPTQVEPLAIQVDGQKFHFTGDVRPRAIQVDGKDWRIQSSDEPDVPLPPGRIQAILSSDGPISIVIADAQEKRELSLALRIAHVLNLYHRLDTQIITESEALHKTRTATWDRGHVVFIGRPADRESQFATDILNRSKVLDKIIDSNSNTKFPDNKAAIFSHPHPSRHDSFMLFLLYSDASALERIARLFPFRTGVAVPDWIVVGPQTDEQGAAGVEAAGVWSNDWQLSPSMTWFHR